MGTVLLFFPTRRTRRVQRLLRHGHIRAARRVSVEPGVWNRRATFELETERREVHQVVVRVPAGCSVREVEHVVYDPGAPDQGLLLAMLPGRPRVDRQGQLAAPLFG